MNELFRNFGLSSSSFVSSSEHSTNQFVGDIIYIKNIHLRLEELIAEGGFGYVFRARDLKTLKIYAVKRMISTDDESRNEIENEILILEKVQPHKHIMEFYGFELIKPNIYYLLCEYCSSGSLKDIHLPITNKQLLNRIIYQTCLAIEKLHVLGIIHRDIKIENILFDTNGFIKLCDFGSATDKSYKPDHNWTPIQRSLLEDEMNRHTTPMYRPPEILDTYLHYEINKSMDIWAFGCLIYYLRFGQHPFDDSSKLRIINCKYSIPSTVNHSEIIVDIIKHCLQVNPIVRIDCSTIIKRMENNFVSLNSPCIAPKTLPTTKTSPNITNNQLITNSSNSVFQNTVNVPGIAQSYLSGFTRYIKDTSNKVMQTVQNSIARQDLDLTFFTSRLIVMSYPAEGLESAYRNHIDDVRAVLESRDSTYSVVNVSGRPYDSSKFGSKVKVIDGGSCWKDPKRVASLQSIITLCNYIFKWMDQNNRHTTAIHCMDGKNNSAMLTISFLILVGLFNDYRRAHKFFISKRNQVELTTSHHRYFNYITKLKKEKYWNFFSIKKNVIIKSICMTGIPLFTKLRDGCRPFIELYTNLTTKIYSTFADYEKLTQYTKGLAEMVVWKDIDTKIDLTSDLCLIISHACSTIGSKMLNQQKLTVIRITSLQCNLFFECDHQNGTHKIVFNLTSLDDIEELDRFPFDFKVEIEFEVFSAHEENVHKLSYKEINENEVLLINKPECIFVDNREYEEFLEINGVMEQNKQDYETENTLEDDPKFIDTSKQDDIESMMNNIELKDSDDISKTKSHNEQKIGEKPDLLLNLSFSESMPGGAFEVNLLYPDKSPEVDLLNDYFHNSKLTTDDLLSMDRSSNLDDQLFASTIKDSLKPTIIDDNISNNTTQSSKIENNLKSKNPSTPNLVTNSLNPFGDLDEYLNFSNSSKNKHSNTSIPRVSSYSAFPEDTKNSKSSSNHSNATRKQTRPDYSRHNFEDIFLKTGVKTPRVNGNEFEDLLGGFKKSNSENNSTKSMAQIRKEEMIKGGANPNRIKVSEWTENKEKNIRALLCSLNAVVWEGCNWSPIGMHQLLTSNDVKKMYRKACLAVHPDKLVGSPHEELAKYIFMELNDAWSEFEKSQR